MQKTLQPYEEFMADLVKEGVRIGKNPWCVSEFNTRQSARILFKEHGISQQESETETTKRRKEEKIIAIQQEISSKMLFN